MLDTGNSLQSEDQPVAEETCWNYRDQNSMSPEVLLIERQKLSLCRGRCQGLPTSHTAFCLSSLEPAEEASPGTKATDLRQEGLGLASPDPKQPQWVEPLLGDGQPQQEGQACKASVCSVDRSRAVLFPMMSNLMHGLLVIGCCV